MLKSDGAGLPDGSLPDGTSADVIVVGAGPAGSSAAFFLARAGLDVLLVEKSVFPREKVCGDGLTPRAVRMLLEIGIDVSPEAGWVRTQGLRMVTSRARFEFDWPDLASFPPYGLVRTRRDLDTMLAQRAVESGARFYPGTTVVGPVLGDRAGEVVGVRARSSSHAQGDGEVTLRAPVVVAADGASSRMAQALGVHRRVDRPLGVAVRTYHTSPRHTDDYLETWFSLPDPRHPGGLLPGYGWVFGMGDGTCNVGVGVLTAPGTARHIDYRGVLGDWLATMPTEWGFSRETQTAPVRGAGLPAGLSRTPLYVPGMLLVGDAGGMVNPFSGEGIAPALEAGRMAADVVVRALGARSPRERERVLASYPGAIAESYGRYYALGRGFVKLIDHPHVFAAAAKYGLSRPVLTRLAFTLASNLPNPRGNAADRLIHVLAGATGPR